MSTTTTAPKTIFTQFYTRNRTRQILEQKGIRVQKIEAIRIANRNGEYLRCVQVTYIVASGRRCSTFLSCKEYLAEAMAGRRERAKDYTASQNSNRPSEWNVYAKVAQLPVEPRTATRGGEGKRRIVITTPTSVSCTCEDYESQGSYYQEHPYLWFEVLKQRRICKHSLCVLSQLGFGSLRDYLAAWKPEGKLSKLAGVMNRKGGTFYSSSSMARSA